jgi:hypothetical protein
MSWIWYIWTQVGWRVGVKISKFRTSKRCTYPDDPTFYNVGPTTLLQSMVAHEPLQSFFFIVPISVARVEILFLLRYIPTKIQSLHQINISLVSSIGRAWDSYVPLSYKTIDPSASQGCGFDPRIGLCFFCFSSHSFMLFVSRVGLAGSNTTTMGCWQSQLHLILCRITYLALC